MSWIESQGYSIFGQYNLTLLDLDEAWLNITNLSNKNLSLYQLSKDCLQCAYVKNSKVSNLKPEESAQIIVDTKFPLTYRLETTGDNDTVLEDDIQNLHCKVKASMGEFGVYEILANENDCEFKTALKPVNIFILERLFEITKKVFEIIFIELIAFLIPILFYLGIGILSFIWRKYNSAICNFMGAGNHVHTPAQSINTIGGQVASPKLNNVSVSNRPRIRSLDTFRGICIVIMIFVNDGAAGYYFLEHATWDGLYVADLVFPWFLWIMGVCIPVSIKSQVKKNIPKLTILRRITIRSLKLIAIGIILNSKGGPIEWGKLRLPGVLQRFGLCYFIAATSVLICANKNFITNPKAANRYIAMIQDIMFIWKGWVITIVAVILHTCLTFLLPVPGCPTGYLGPGGLHSGDAYPGECVGGAAGYIDRKILGLKHIYQWPTAIGTYRSAAYDPEGLLGTLTSILTVWLGVQAGLTMQVYPKHKSRIIRWSVWAVITGVIAAALCEAKQTGGVIPLNKNLWSLSFVFTLSSFALVLLISLYLIIDVWGIWSGTPFFEPGMNSILLYIGHSIANDLLPWHFRFKRMNTHFKRLVESLWGTSLWVLYSIYLFHKKFFWSL